MVESVVETPEHIGKRISSNSLNACIDPSGTFVSPLDSFKNGNLLIFSFIRPDFIFLRFLYFL